MRHKQYGFSLVEAVLALLIAGLIITAAVVVINMQRKDATMNGNDNRAIPALHSAQPELTRWPVEIADLDPDAHMAGDVYMNDAVLLASGEQPVIEFGRERIQKGQTITSASRDIGFLVRPGAPVYAVSNGYVVKIAQNSPDEYAIHMAPGKAEAWQWEVAYVHVAQPKVKVGESVRAGAPIGIAAPVSGQSYGAVGLQVVYYATSNKEGSGEARCPSSFIADGAKQRMTAQFLLLTKAWETQAASGGIYNEPAWTRLACVKDKIQL